MSFSFTDPANNEAIVPDFNNDGFEGSTRFVELFNIDCEPVDLSNGWQLVRFTNGMICTGWR